MLVPRRKYDALPRQDATRRQRLVRWPASHRKHSTIAWATVRPCTGPWTVIAYTDKRSGIKTPHRLDDPQPIIRLIGKVMTVSLETVKIVGGRSYNKAKGRTRLLKPEPFTALGESRRTSSQNPTRPA